MSLEKKNKNPQRRSSGRGTKARGEPGCVKTGNAESNFAFCSS